MRGPHFLRQRSWGRLLLCDADAFAAGLRQVLADPDRAMAEGTTLKHDRTSTLALVQAGGRHLVIKRSNLKGPWHRLRRMVRPTRAMISWRNAHRLMAAGIPTPAPLALLERRWGPLRGRSYFIAEHVEGVHGVHFFRDLDPPPPPVEQAKAVAAMLHILARLAEERLIHRDLKASNFIIGGAGVWLTDLDAMRPVRSERRFRRLWARDLARFRANFRPGSVAAELIGPGVDELERRFAS